ncbi:MAG: heme-binding domain-containing protein [Terracidiphilus sp.]
MTKAKTATAFCALALMASFALARIHPFGDAGLFKTMDAEDPIMEGSSVPAEVRAILSAKCADCHSLQTRAPFYGRLAPASWLMERDINRGRQAMNLAHWNALSDDRQQTLAAKIVQKTREHDMPPFQYLLIHRDGGITGADLRTLAAWAHESGGSSSGQSNAPGGEGDPTRGAALFEKRCTGCHALTANHEGPKLEGVYGRTTGSVAGFAYSPALKKANVVWDQTTLDKWLADPDAFISGNEMDFLVSKPQERKDLIAFLKQKSGK